MSVRMVRFEDQVQEPLRTNPPRPPLKSISCAQTNFLHGSSNRRRSITVEKLLDQAKYGDPVLDLSSRGLISVPDDILLLAKIQYLYLKKNAITSLPEVFFDSLPNLKWLDLRWNKLAALPTIYIGRHEHLEALLLQSNQLKTLPLELGLIPTLRSLNIAENPLEFPPQEVIETGVQGILAFLRELLRAKSLGTLYPVTRVEQYYAQYYYDSDSEEPELIIINGPLPRSPSSHNSHRSSRKMNNTFDLNPLPPVRLEDDLVGPMPMPVPLHKPVSYKERKMKQSFKLERLGITRDVKSKKLSPTLNNSPDNHFEIVEEKYLHDRHQRKIKEIKEKQDMILQKRNDAEKLKEFRQKTKDMQQKKMKEKIMKGGILEYDKPAEQAPYGIEHSHLHMASNEERIKYDPKNDKIPPRPLSPKSLKKLEDARDARDMELQKRLRDHQDSMQERRQQPQGTAMQEMEAAMKELQVAQQLQKEIEARRKELEYRFRAFTGGDY